MSSPPPLVSNATPFFEHSELKPINTHTNGPQLFYGLRYHTHIVKPGDHTDRNTLTLVASPTPNPLARAT